MYGSFLPARALGIVCLCLGLAIPQVASGQGVASQKALAAQALYDQGSADMDAKNYASACPKLEEVTRLVPEGIGARLTLGECYEALGKLASAWSQFALVETMATRAGQPERSKKAAAAAAALKPRLATLAIDLEEPTRSIRGLVITRDGVAVGDAQWSTPLPVDVGAHEVVVTAPGYKTWKKTAEVVTDGVPVVLKVKPLEAELEVTTQPAPLGPVAPLPPATAPWDRTWQRPVGLAAIVAGNAGVVFGGLLGIIAIAKKGESNQPGRCDARNTCDPIGLVLRHEAVGLGNASTGALIAGAAVLAGGVVLFATAPPRQEEKGKQKNAPGSKATAFVGILPGGAQIIGQW